MRKIKKPQETPDYQTPNAASIMLKGSVLAMFIVLTTLGIVLAILHFTK